MSSDATPDRQATPEEFVQRAALLADLGRYADAVTELGYAIALAPGHRAGLTLLARVHLADGQPAAALAAADAAVAAVAAAGAVGGEAGGAAGVATLDALGARAMALLDLRRYAEAADLAEGLLRSAPEDPPALALAAAVLAQSRNGQRALDAAWQAVRLAPGEAHHHLVLGLVAAQLELFQLAEQAYREALALDPDLARARHDIGVIRLEQRRYSEALEALAEAATSRPAAPPAAGGDAPAGPAAPPSPARLAPLAHGVRRLLQLGAAYGLLAPVLVACAATGDRGLSRVQAVALGVIGVGMLAVLATRLPGRVREVLPPLMRADRALAVAVYGVAAGPILVLLYAVVGTPWPLAAAVAAGFAALLANVLADYRT